MPRMSKAIEHPPIPITDDKKYGEPYECSKCGVDGVKLWRQYNTLACYIELMCVDCAEKDQDKKCMLEAEDRFERTDQIGWLIPAVPTPDRHTFWGYTSVPEDGCVWWKDLPLRK